MELGEVNNEEDASAEGVGAATPAVFEPSPSFCKVSASNFPVGFNPWDD